MVFTRRGNPLEETHCLSCSSFKEYMKATRNKLSQEHNISSQPNSFRRASNCPLDKDELGRNTWGFLHMMAARYPKKPTGKDQEDMKQFLNLFSKFYPCNYCAAELQENLKVDPPKVASQEIFSQWLCRLHNKVNIKLGKPQFDCYKINERWKDGWLDGSCN